MALPNFNTRLFSTLKNLSFFKTILQVFKTISGVCSKNKGEGHLEILINGSHIKKGFGCWWVVVGHGGYILAGGGWWWIYFGWWWMVVGGGIV